MKIFMTREDLFRAYSVERKSTRQVAALLGCSQPWARKVLRENGIKIRDKLDREPPIPKGTKLTEEHKQKIGEANRRAFANKSDKSRPWTRTGENVPCAHCGKTLWRMMCHLKFKLHFCGTVCHGKWRSANMKGEAHPTFIKRINAECAQCGESVVRKQHEITMSKNFFCSPKCNGEWKSQNLVGSEIYNWKGGYDGYYGENWSVQKRLARKRDGNACQRCGKTKEELERNLDVHHKIPFRSFGVERFKEANALENLVCYCNSCHKIVEEILPVL